ncbi:phosphonate degradation HD-domain oxygenase [Zavarzinella formosa]|uniref:phosphonate degradation HD-domain oxygenase n=1 Tax=Zavarzinella formosa TaxID=360055 RepID=UPI000304620C|nr:phosphonate degradation HD-domain oxygenase [Zavarzinella formosa]
MTVIDQLFALFAEKGSGAYFGEDVTETAHALQCARLAEEAGADDALVAAALLHDVGHLLHGMSENIAKEGLDGQHEDAGAEWLQKHFGPAIVDPVRLHVAAKRYLCAVEPGYHDDLSPASQLSLRLQGGPFTPEEAKVFEAEPWYQSAVAVRRWDDEAKIPGLLVPDLEHYRPKLEAALLAR